MSYVERYVGDAPERYAVTPSRAAAALDHLLELVERRNRLDISIARLDAERRRLSEELRGVQSGLRKITEAHGRPQ